MANQALVLSAEFFTKAKRLLVDQIEASAVVHRQFPVT